MKPKFNGRLSVACNINFICEGAGVQVVARVPSAGPVPPPTKVVMPTNVTQAYHEIRQQDIDGKLKTVENTKYYIDTL